jgi:uncharacterized protein
MPTIEEIIALHKKYAPNNAAFDRVYGHCRVVWDTAQQLLSRRPQQVNKELVRAGCLLHDIGVYRLYGDDGLLHGENYIRHGILGEELLRSEGYPDELCRIASHHTGTGLTRHDVVQQKLQLPLADYTARTIEERLVMYADKFHSKTEPPQLNSVQWYSQHIGRFGMQKVGEFDALVREFGEPDLVLLAAKYHIVIR